MEEGENEEDLSALLSPWQSGSAILRDTKNSLDRADQSSRSSLQPPFFSQIYEKPNIDVKLPPLNDEIIRGDEDGMISGIKSTRSRVSSKHQDFPRKVHSTEFGNNQPQNLASYFAQFNGDNFNSITKKLEKEKTLVYDCFGELEVIFPFSMRSDVKRRLQLLLNQLKQTKRRYKRSSQDEDNHQLLQMYYPSDKNLLNSQINEKNNANKSNNLQNASRGVLSERDKTALKVVRCFPERKVFPNMSSPFKVQLDEKSIFFDSKFENANLRRAYRAGEQEYDLVLDFDVGTDHFTQWFYFRTANLKKGSKVKFNIVNLYKDRSLFENGMRPMVFSQRDYEKKNIGWHRDGINVTYIRNDFKRINFTNTTKSESGGSNLNWNTSNNNGNTQSGNIYMNKKKNSLKNYQSCNSNSNSNILSSNSLNMNANSNNNNNNNPTFYFTLSFTYIYQNDEDIVYFATSVPYTYPFLHHYLTQLQAHRFSNKFSHVDTLTTTPIGNRIFCMTVTDDINDEFHPSHDSKKEIVISGRVHPGESNSSWILKGMMDFILSEHEIARSLRKKFIFRIIPMLNPDGVRYGNYRCCILGNDLNRRWRNANELLHSPIYAMKELVKRLQTCEEGGEEKKKQNNPPCLPQSEGREVELFIDVHGHSKQLSAFIYGCQFKSEEPKVSSPREQSNVPGISDLKSKNNNLKQLAYLYGLRKSFFDYEQCLFGMQKDKQGTARMVGFNELGIVKSFTLECSLYGYKNKNEGQVVSELNSSNSISSNFNSSNKVFEMGPDEFEEVGRELLISLEINTQGHIQNLISALMSSADQQPQIMGELKKILRERECTGVIRPPGFLKSGFAFNPAVDYHVANGDDLWDQEKLKKKKDHNDEEEDNDDYDNDGIYQGQSQLQLHRQTNQDGSQGHFINDEQQFKSAGDNDLEQQARQYVGNDTKNTQIPRQKQHLVEYLQRASKISEQFLEYQLIQASKSTASNNYSSFPSRNRAHNIADKLLHNNSDSRQNQIYNTIIMPISQDSLISSPKNTPKNISFSTRKTLDTSIVVFQSAGMDSMSYVDKKTSTVNTPRLRINSNNGRDIQGTQQQQQNLKQSFSAKIMDGFLLQQNQEFTGLSQNHQPFQSPLVWRQPSLKVNRKSQGIGQNQLVHLSRQASCFKQQQQQNHSESTKNSNNNNNNSKSDSDVLLSQAAVASLISGRYSLKFQSKKTIQILRENSEKEDKNNKKQYKNNNNSSSSRYNLNNVTLGMGPVMNEDSIPSATDRCFKDKKGNQEMFYLRESKDVEYLLPKMNKFQDKSAIS